MRCFLTWLFVCCLCLSSGHAADAKAPPKKVALLFLTIKDLNHADVWQKLLEDAGDQYNIYIHSKEPLEHPFFKNYRIAKIVPTNWAQHIRAWHELFKEAVANPENVKFVLLSESCVPLYTLNKIYEQLLADDLSYMAYARPWWPASHPREVHEIFPEFRYGNNEWMVLNRKHAELVAADVSIINVVANHVHDQESYFGILFAIHNCLSEVVNRMLTYVNWEHAENGGHNPYTFREVNPLSNDLLNDAYQLKALFARKFAKSYPEGVLLQSIEAHSK